MNARPARAPALRVRVLPRRAIGSRVVRRPWRCFQCEIRSGDAEVTDSADSTKGELFVCFTAHSFCVSFAPAAIGAASTGGHNGMRRTITSLTMALLVVGGFTEPIAIGAPAVHADIPPAVVPAPAGGTISGQVTDDQGAVIPGVTIQVLGAVTKTLGTGPEGRYLFTDLPDGSYRVSVNTGSPKPPTFSPFQNYPESIDVTSVAGQTGVDFVLPRPAIVTGTVRNEAGVPVPNAQIAGLALFQSVSTGPDGSISPPSIPELGRSPRRPPATSATHRRSATSGTSTRSMSTPLSAKSSPRISYSIRAARSVAAWSTPMASALRRRSYRQASSTR